MQEKEIENILNNYKNGTATEAEIALLESWYLTFQEPESYEFSIEERSKDLDQVLANLKGEEPVAKRFMLWPRIVAAMLILTLAGSVLYWNKNSSVKSEKPIAKHNILPGGNKATLTLANGQIIDLSVANTDDLEEQAGILITRTADGQLIYTVKESPENEAVKSLFNTIETPKGGQYQVILPDGSKVWLNAASILKYPANLSSLNERKVELKGEAYFEVAKLKNKPFTVITNNQIVQVMGTHFNVKSYADDKSTKTTLLEGIVRVSSESNSFNAVILKPGQQSKLKGTKIEISNVEVEDEVDWKNGDFVFKAEKLESIMRKISRWYDVDIVYEGNVPQDVALEGLVSRSKSINEVLALMESTGRVHFKIENKQIIVTK